MHPQRILHTVRKLGTIKCLVQASNDIDVLIKNAVVLTPSVILCHLMVNDTAWPLESLAAVVIAKTASAPVRKSRWPREAQKLNSGCGQTYRAAATPLAVSPLLRSAGAVR